MIPLFRTNTDPAPTQRLALDNLQRPRVNNAPVIEGLRAMGQAVQGKQVDPTPFVQAAGAMGAIGDALQKTGSIIGAAEVKRQEVYDRTKLNEAHIAMQEFQQDYADWQKVNKDATNNFVPEAQKRVEAFMQRFGKLDGISQQAQADLKMMADSWGRRMVKAADTDAKITVNENGRKSYVTRAQIHYSLGQQAEGDAAVNEAEKMLLLHDYEAADIRNTGAQMVKNQRINSITSGLNAAVMAKQEALIPSFLQQLKDAGAEKNFILETQEKAMLTLKRNQEIEQSKRQTERYGGLMAKFAEDPQSVTKQELRSIHEEGDLSDMQFANVMNVVVNQQGTDPSAFSKFLTDKVLKYDPTDDIIGDKRASLIKEAFGMGPSKIQAGQFNELLARVEASARTPAGKGANALEAWGRSHISDMEKLGAFGAFKTSDTALNPQFIAALKDREKIAAVLGVEAKDDTLAGKIALAAKEDPGKAAEMFAKAQKLPFAEVAKNEAIKGKDPKGQGLDEAGYNWLIRSAPGGVNQNAAESAGAISAEIQDKFTLWFNEFSAKEKRIPSEKEVRAKIGELTYPYTARNSQSTTIWKPAPVVKNYTAQGGTVTDFGQPDDKWRDSRSALGIGAFVPQEEENKIRRGEYSDYKMKEGDFGVSPDIESVLRESGVRPMQKIKLMLADGSSIEGRWMDLTANDEQAKQLGLPPLRNRWDIYTPTGKHPKRGVRVVGFDTLD